MGAYSSGKIIELERRLNPSDNTLTANIDVGVTSGRFYFRNDRQEEWLSFSSVTVSGDNFVYGGLVRQLAQTGDNPASQGSGFTWTGGNQAVLVAMHDQLPNLNLGLQIPDGQTLRFNGTDVQIRRTGNELFLRSGTTPEVSLATLAAASGTDTNVRVSVNDTTSSNLNAKTAVGDGIVTSIVNPGANEQLRHAVRLLTTNGLRFVGGQIDISPASNAQVGSMRFATDQEVIDGASVPAAVFPLQIRNTYLNRYATTNGTLIGGASNGTFTIPHGLGAIPKNLVFEFPAQASVGYRPTGYYANNNGVISIRGQRNNNNGSEPLTFINNGLIEVLTDLSPIETYRYTVASVDSTNITIQRLLTGPNPIAAANISYILNASS